MRKSATRHTLIFKIVSIVMVLSMVLNDMALAADRINSGDLITDKLAPLSRFIYGEDFIIDRETRNEPEISRRFQDDAAIIYASRLIGRALETAESADNLSEKALRTLLERHLGHVDPALFDPGSLKKDGKTFCLTISHPEGKLLRYYLPSDKPQNIAGKSSMAAGTHKTRLIVENPDTLDAPGSDTRLLLPAAQHIEYGEEFREKLASMKEYGLQNTFERAMVYEEGAPFREDPHQFLLYAAQVYAGDTPKNDLAAFPFFLDMRSQSLSSDARKKISREMETVFGQLSALERILPGITISAGTGEKYIKDIGPREAKMFLQMVLAKKRSHMESIGRLKDAVKKELPDDRLLNDMLAYYRKRVMEFFQEFQDRVISLEAAEIRTSSHPPSPVILPNESTDRRLKDPVALARLNKFIDAIRQGKYQKKAKVDLRGLSDDVEIIIVGDLHERLDNFRAILEHRGKSSGDDRAEQEDTVLSRIRQGKAVLVFLGDAIHADRDVASPGALSMERSLEIMEWIMRLKIQNPDHVYYILGNHDDPDADCVKRGVDPVTGIERLVDQSMLYKDKIRSTYGEDYLERYRDFISVSPLRLLADGLAGMHDGPPRGLTLDQIKKIRHKDIVADGDNMSAATMLWGRYAGSLSHTEKIYHEIIERSGFSSSDIARYLREVRQPGAFFVVAHSPHMIPKGNFYHEFEENRFVVYGAMDVTGYFSYKPGRIEAFDVSKRDPVAVYYANGRKAAKPGSSNIRSLLRRVFLFGAMVTVFTPFMFAGLYLSGGVPLLLADTASGALALRVMSSSRALALGLAAGGIICAGLGVMVPFSGRRQMQGISSSLQHIKDAAARSVETARNNEDITTQRESRLQMCPLEYLTDPEKVDITVSAADLPVVYLLMDKIIRGDLSAADGRAIRIHIREGEKAAIWEGKHRLEALRRLGVSEVPAHVMYMEKRLADKYPFRDITYGLSEEYLPEKVTINTKETVLGPNLLKKAEEESHSPEVEKIQSEIGLQRSFVDSPEKWGLYAPTPVTVALNMLFYVKKIKPDAAICDIGSGMGRFCFMAAAAPSLRFPRVTGIEARESLHAEALEYKKQFRDLPGTHNVNFINGDFLKEDLSGHDVLYFFYTHPSTENRESFNRKLFEKMTGPTGLKPGARFIMWGNFDDISDGERLIGEKVRMGRHDFMVYSRPESYIPPSGISNIIFNDRQMSGDELIDNIRRVSSGGHLFNVLLKGDTAYLGVMESGADPRFAYHGQIPFSPSLEDPFTLKMWVEKETLELDIAYNIRGARLFRRFEKLIELFNTSIRMARVLVESGFPADTKLSEQGKGALKGLSYFSGTHPETLGSLARMDFIEGVSGRTASDGSVDSSARHKAGIVLFLITGAFTALAALNGWVLPGFRMLMGTASELLSLGYKSIILPAVEFLIVPAVMGVITRRSTGEKIENPYGREENISRRFSDLDRQYLNDISEELHDRTDPYHGKKQKDGPPVKILHIGAGRGLEAFDMIHMYGKRVDITVTAKEDLLFDSAEDLLMHGGYMIPEEQARGYIERLRSKYIECDLDQGIDLEDNSFDMVIIDEYTLAYVKDKWAAIKEMIRVCNAGGVVYCSPRMAGIITEEGELTFGEYFAKIGHPEIDSLTMSDLRQVDRQHRTSNWLKITKKENMVLPGLELTGHKPVRASIGGKAIEASLWESSYREIGDDTHVDESMPVHHPTDAPSREKKLVDVASSLEEAAELFKKNTRAQIEIQASDDLPPIYADPDAVAEQLADLLRKTSNKLSPDQDTAGTGKIYLQAGIVEKDGRKSVEITAKGGSGMIEKAVSGEVSLEDTEEEALIRAEEVARAFVDTVMISLIESKTDQRNTVLVLSADLIERYYREDPAYRDINQLLIALRRFCRSRGITLVVSRNHRIVSDIDAEMKREENADAQVIVIADSEHVRSSSFRKIRNDERVFIAGVDGQTSRIMELAVLAMKMAYGYDTNNIAWANGIKWENDPEYPNMFTFSLPAAGSVNWQDPVKIYQRQREVLIKA